MEEKATCVLPQPTKSPEIHYVGTESEIWLGDIDNGMKVIFYTFNKNN